MKDHATDKTHLILVNGVVFRGNKVLVSQRSWEELHEPGKWTIPGGKVEKTKGGIFKIIEKTLKDEVKEETGEDIINCKWVTIGEVKKMKFSPNVKKYIIEAFNK